MGRGRGHRSQHRPGRGKVRKPRLELAGTIRVLAPGRATVSTEEGTFTIAKGGIREAMDGDEVRVILVTRAGQHMAVVRSVVARATASFVGRYGTAGPLGVVSPLDGRMTHDFFVLPEDTSAERLGVSEGDVVVARILEYPARGTSGVVTLERRVGAADEVALDMEAIIASYGLRTDFGQAVLNEAAAVKVDAQTALASDPQRRDLRSALVVTIDPADARDFDDAVEARRVGDGYEVGVHIADVTHYVNWGSSMDLEARLRTCSTYLADRVLPMLPEHLCNDVCSLRQEVDRLCMSVRMRLDDKGGVLDAQAFPSVIRSSARLAYEQVDELLEGRCEASDLPCANGQHEAVAQTLRILDEVARLRRRVRRQRGAVDFDTREAKVVLDETGKPTNIVVRERTAATSLVEEAMLLANESVAQMLSQADMASAYRTHERPSPEDLKGTVGPLREAGLLRGNEVDGLIAGEPYVLQQVLRRAQGTTYEHLANGLLLRAQKRAVYLPKNDGHYALGARAYCHFTSPIRRYPDTLVHRALKSLLTGQVESGEQGQIARLLPQLCRTCSDQERVADAAARMSQKVKMAEYYAERIGERCAGIVVGCERFGLFVMIEDTCAEGLLGVRELSDGWVSFDPVRLTLTDEASARTWRLGQRVAVEVARVDVPRGLIDFALVGHRA